MCHGLKPIWNGMTKVKPLPKFTSRTSHFCTVQSPQFPFPSSPSAGWPAIWKERVSRPTAAAAERRVQKYPMVRRVERRDCHEGEAGGEQAEESEGKKLDSECSTECITGDEELVIR